MKSLKKFHFIVLWSVLGFLFHPHTASASVTYITSDSDATAVKDTVSVEVRIDTQDQSINVVEGDIAIESNRDLIEIREISVSGSNMTFWSRKPSLSEDRKTISFVGGVPGGFNQPDGLLFKIFFTAKNPGTVSFTPQNVKAYVNDGKGTLASNQLKALTTIISPAGKNHQTKDEWTRVVSSDNMPPEFLAATVGKDPDTMGDHPFLMIQGTDYQSGIDHYEVKEGDFDFVRSGNVYVLQDPTQSVSITIQAYDKAGNVRTLIIEPSFAKRYGKEIVFITLPLLVVLIGVGVWFIKRKSNKKS